MMTIDVKFFASLRDAAGLDACRLELAPGARGHDVKAALSRRYRRLEGITDDVRLAVNGVYRSWETPIADGDELALIPPVSGG